MKSLIEYILERYKLDKDIEGYIAEGYTNIDKLIDWYIGVGDTYQVQIYSLGAFVKMIIDLYPDFKLSHDAEFLSKYYDNHCQDKIKFKLSYTYISFNMPECGDIFYTLELKDPIEDFDREIKALSVK